MVYENDVHLLKIGQKVDFTVANLPDEELVATIFAVGKEFESNTRAVHVHAKLDSNPGNLIPGMYISGHIHTDENYTRSLPNDAIVTEGTNAYIFVQDNSEISEEPQEHGDENAMAFRMEEVVTGKTDEGYTEIKLLNPLPEDTRVVLNVAYYLLSDLKKEETEHED